MLGKSLKEQGIFDLYPEEKKRYYVKVPVFSSNKIKGLDTYLSPEMKSTGEAIGYDNKLNRALYKALTASGTKLRNYGTVFATLAGDDKAEALPDASGLYRFPDGRVWSFRTEALDGTGLEGFSQVTAQDVTELFSINRQLAAENAELNAAIDGSSGTAARRMSAAPASKKSSPLRAISSFFPPCVLYSMKRPETASTS